MFECILKQLQKHYLAGSDFMVVLHRGRKAERQVLLENVFSLVKMTDYHRLIVFKTLLRRVNVKKILYE